MNDAPPPLYWSVLRIIFQIALLCAIAYGVHLLIYWLEDRAKSMSPASGALMLTSVIALMLLVYSILIAVPFVPGIEIGVMLMVMRGPAISPYVYVATVAGLTLAFIVGRYVSFGWLRGFLRDCRFLRASRMVERIQFMPASERIDLLCDWLPDWLGPHLMRWRYVGLGVLFNIPGNSLIGGGGGISLIAGLSGVFSPGATAATIALAVSPVPILVWFFGVGLLM